jgi:hypothetical protein
MIPLNGAKVRVKTGSRQGQVGIAEIVYDADDAIRESEGMVKEFVSRCRARFGESWRSRWYEAEVSFPDGSERMSGDALTIVEPEMVRPDRYSKA